MCYAGNFAPTSVYCLLRSSQKILRSAFPRRQDHAAAESAKLLDNVSEFSKGRTHSLCHQFWIRLPGLHSPMPIKFPKNVIYRKQDESERLASYD